MTKTRRFARAPPPTGTIEAVQVDHSTGTLRVAGAPFVGVGWYISWAPGLKNLSAAVADMTARCVTQGMVYGLATEPVDAQLSFLDACAAAAFKVLYPVGTGANVSINHGGPFDNATPLEPPLANVTLVRQSPALLPVAPPPPPGYYRDTPAGAPTRTCHRSRSC